MGTGLRVVDREQVGSVDLVAIPLDWAEVEVTQRPEPWLGPYPHLYALERMAVFGDKRAMKELLLLGGSNAERERQIRASRSAAANRAKAAVHDALSLLVVRAY